MGQPVTLAALAAVGVVLGLAGPFGTERLLDLLPRTAYWLWIVAATYGAGALVSAVLRARLAAWPVWRSVLAEGIASGLVIALLVLASNALVFGWIPTGAELPEFLATLLVITIIVNAGLHHLASQRPKDDPPPQTPPAILERLPLDKRGPLVALSVEDHYVRVRTVKAEVLLLMRLSDAMRETGDVAGGQVHRSHWVAWGQVTAARREGDRAILSMTWGGEIPVSRANVAKIREAGLLPR